MFNKLLVLIFLFTSQIFAGYLAIEDPDDCERVANNVRFFWLGNKQLIEPLVKGNELSHQQKQDLLDNQDPIVQGIIEEFSTNPKTTIQAIRSSIKYCFENKKMLEEAFGKNKYSNLFKGLKFLKKLAGQFR